MNTHQQPIIRIALIGNPNSGKTTIFNALTGLNQQTGNFPGVTVDKKIGYTYLTKNGTSKKLEIIDLPGIYSLYPKSIDETVTYQTLFETDNQNNIDVFVVVADASNLKRNLYLCSQLIDLKLPIILVLNMMDIVEKAGLQIDITLLSQLLDVPVVGVDARNDKEMEKLKDLLYHKIKAPNKHFFNIDTLAPKAIKTIQQLNLDIQNDYLALQIAHNYQIMPKYAAYQTAIQTTINTCHFDSIALQKTEIIERYKALTNVVKACVKKNKPMATNLLTQKIDQFLTHKIFGYVAFVLILFLIFQAIYTLASWPMEWIEWLFTFSGDYLKAHLPNSMLTDLLTDGVLAGLGGIMVFVPQIAFLFLFIAILEDTGYMARASFIMDKLMRPFGLNGKSIVPLMSGVACAIPAIMATRTINNWKERTITILVTPLVSCSARLPVYTLLIALVIPEQKLFGILNLQGLVLMMLYLLGIFSALGIAIALRWMIKSKEQSFFVMELPIYRLPKAKTVFLSIFEKIKIFITDAGKVILAMSVVLWILASFAPGNTFAEIDKKYEQAEFLEHYSAQEIANLKAKERLENSYAGKLGKLFVPIIEPLGYDWRIGIALVSSFAAREVFVGTMATIYSIGSVDDGNPQNLINKMQADINPRTNKPYWTLAVGLSLLVFYVFAMQCMSTIAIVKRETKSWKWALLQFSYMGFLAYAGSWIVFNLFK